MQDLVEFETNFGRGAVGSPSILGHRLGRAKVQLSAWSSQFTRSEPFLQVSTGEHGYMQDEYGSILVEVISRASSYSCVARCSV